MWPQVTAHLLWASHTQAGSFLLALSPLSGTQAVYVSFSCAFALPARALETSVGNNLDFGMLEALPQGMLGAKHSITASGPTCHFLRALLLSQSHPLDQRKPGIDEIGE